MKCPTCGQETGIYIQKPMVTEPGRVYPVRDVVLPAGRYAGILFHEDGSVELVKEADG